MDVKLTKREALKICMLLWQWLAKHPSKVKIDWPGWKKYEGGWRAFENECPCCEYVAQKFDNHGGIYAHSYECNHCPLSALWGDDCTNDDSPFDEWVQYQNHANKKECAEKIAKAAEKAWIRELNK